MLARQLRTVFHRLDTTAPNDDDVLAACEVTNERFADQGAVEVFAARSWATAS